MLITKNNIFPYKSICIIITQLASPYIRFSVPLETADPTLLNSNVGNTFLQNVDKHLQDNAASQPRRPQSNQKMCVNILNL